jgi:spermidine synthase
MGCDHAIDLMPDPQQVDATLAAATIGGFRMFDGRTLLGMYQPPKYLRDALAKETRVFTLSDPAKFFGSGVAAR